VIFADAVRQLERGLRGELPGPAAQLRLAPVPRREWPAGFNPARIRDAAGLLLVFPKNKTMNAKPAKAAEQENSFRARALDSTINPDLAESAEPEDSWRALRSLRSTSGDTAHIVLTVRADTLGRHSGQVSLPGGVIEPGETFEQAALREAHEEVGLSPDGVRVLGALTALDIPVSGFRLQPIVAVTEAHPHLAASDGEVARILEIDLDDLMNPVHFVSTTRERDGIALKVPAFHVAGHEIWGATAMVLAEFLVLLGWSVRASGPVAK
jgi:8-oxo-dGTP pyrophosphatase MutT (NUDIX family)